MILIPSVTEEQLLPPDGQCSWQQYWIGYDLYFTWTGYYLIYATLTCISTQLSEEKKLLSRDLISVPISTYFLANELLNEKGCLYFHVPHKCELPAAVYYMYIAPCVYSVLMYIYVWPAISRSMKHEEQKSDEHLWTMNNNESDHIFYMPLLCSSRWNFNRRKYLLKKEEEFG